MKQRWVSALWKDFVSHAVPLAYAHAHLHMGRHSEGFTPYSITHTHLPPNTSTLRVEAGSVSFTNTACLKVQCVTSGRF